MSATGIIYDIKKYAIHDGPGIRTTVFLKGCPLDCWWCHNPESRLCDPQPRKKMSAQKNLKLLSNEEQLIGKRVTVDEVLEEVRKDVLFYDESGGGVTLSGGEPLMQIEFLTALLQRCKQEQFHTAVDTSGYADFKYLEKIELHTDLFLYDIKFIDDQLHQEYTGKSNRSILENLLRLSQGKNKIHIRIPLIPDITDTENNIRQIMNFLQNRPALNTVELLPYNKMGDSKYERLEIEQRIGNLEIQNDLKIDEMKNRFRVRGFRVL